MEEELETMTDSMVIMTAVGRGNPGAYTVISKLFAKIGIDETYETDKTYDTDDTDDTEFNKIMNFIKKLLQKNIVGPRLWYIYKNEAQFNINKLIELNLDFFNDLYFYEKFEKYYP